MVEREGLSQFVMVNGEVIAASGLGHWGIVASEASIMPPFQDGTPGCLGHAEIITRKNIFQRPCDANGQPQVNQGFLFDGNNNQLDNSSQPRTSQPQAGYSNNATSGISDVRELRTEVGATVGNSIDSSLAIVDQMTGLGACLTGWIAIEAISLGASRFRFSLTAYVFKGIYKAIRWLA